eukprot:jgi/Mesen1/3922/ME000209S02932
MSLLIQAGNTSAVAVVLAKVVAPALRDEKKAKKKKGKQEDLLQDALDEANSVGNLDRFLDSVIGRGVIRAEPETRSEPRTQAEPKTLSEFETWSEPKTRAEPETRSEPETWSEPKTRAEPKTRSEPESARLLSVEEDSRPRTIQQGRVQLSEGEESEQVTGQRGVHQAPSADPVRGALAPEVQALGPEEEGEEVFPHTVKQEHGAAEAQGEGEGEGEGEGKGEEGGLGREGHEDGGEGEAAGERRRVGEEESDGGGKGEREGEEEEGRPRYERVGAGEGAEESRLKDGTPLSTLSAPADPPASAARQAASAAEIDEPGGGWTLFGSQKVEEEEREEEGEEEAEGAPGSPEPEADGGAEWAPKGALADESRAGPEKQGAGEAFGRQPRSASAGRAGGVPAPRLPQGSTSGGGEEGEEATGGERLEACEERQSDFGGAATGPGGESSPGRRKQLAEVESAGSESRGQEQEGMRQEGDGTARPETERPAEAADCVVSPEDRAVPPEDRVVFLEDRAVPLEDCTVTSEDRELALLHESILECAEDEAGALFSDVLHLQEDSPGEDASSPPPPAPSLAAPPRLLPESMPSSSPQQLEPLRPPPPSPPQLQLQPGVDDRWQGEQPDADRWQGEQPDADSWQAEQPGGDGRQAAEEGGEGAMVAARLTEEQTAQIARFAARILQLLKQDRRAGALMLLEGISIRDADVARVARHIQGQPLAEVVNKIRFFQSMMAGMDRTKSVSARVGRMLSWLSIEPLEDVQLSLAFFQRLAAQKGGLGQLDDSATCLPRLLEAFPTALQRGLDDELAPLVRNLVEEWGVPRQDVGLVCLVFPVVLLLDYERDLAPRRRQLKLAGIRGRDRGRITARWPWLLSATMAARLEPLAATLRSFRILLRDIDGVITSCPQLLGCCPEKVLGPAASHLEELGLRGALLGRALVRCPQLLLRKRSDLHAVLNYLGDQGVPLEYSTHILTRNPSVLTMRIEPILAGKFEFLRSTLQLGRRRHWVGRIVRFYPEVLTRSVQAMSDRLDYLHWRGLSRDAIRLMVFLFPPLLGCNVDTMFRPKLDFLIDEMGGSVEDVVLYPRFFSFSLEDRIKRRFRVVSNRGLAHECDLFEMLSPTDEEFAERFLGLGRMLVPLDP